MNAAQQTSLWGLGLSCVVPGDGAVLRRSELVSNQSERAAGRIHLRSSIMYVHASEYEGAGGWVELGY